MPFFLKIYLDPIGANVEVFQLDIFDFLKPQKTIDYFKPVSRELEKDDRRVLIHGFSIGAFAVAGLQGKLMIPLIIRTLKISTLPKINTRFLH